jgi:hypothetical protein
MVSTGAPAALNPPAWRHLREDSKAAGVLSIWKPSGMNPMIKRYGIDTLILVRLATGDPEEGFQRSVQRLTAKL